MKGRLAQIALTIALLFLPAVARAQGRAAIVIAERAGMYELPARSLGMKVEIANKTPIRVLDQRGNWYVVRVADLVGWMPKSTVRITGSSDGSRSEIVSRRSERRRGN